MEFYLEFCTAKNDIHAHVFPDFNFSTPTILFHFGVIKNKYETKIKYSRQMEYNRKFLGKKTKLHSIPTSQISISPKMFRFGKKILDYFLYLN